MIRRIAATPALLVLAFLCISLLAGPQEAGAQVKPEPLAENSNWKSHSYVSDGSKVCYMHAKPAKSTGNWTRRGAPNVMVTRRQGSRTTEEVSVTSGYPYKEKEEKPLQDKEEKPVQVTIDGRKFIFDLTHGEHAWVSEESADSTVVKAMIRGRELKVRGVSRKDTYSEDSYSLIGFTKIHDAIVRACP